MKVVADGHFYGLRKGLGSFTREIKSLLKMILGFRGNGGKYRLLEDFICLGFWYI